MQRFWIAIFILYGSLRSAKLCDRVRANNQRELAGMCANLLHFANTKRILHRKCTVHKNLFHQLLPDIIRLLILIKTNHYHKAAYFNKNKPLSLGCLF
jgi:hypothetical protein